jgi:hypothetical protein
MNGATSLGPKIPMHRMVRLGTATFIARDASAYQRPKVSYLSGRVNCLAKASSINTMTKGVAVEGAP